MNRIKYILLALAMTLVLPVSANAASFTFVPMLGSYSTGATFSTSVFVTPASGETISAAKISLTFPANKLEIVSYTPVNGGNILAHIGTQTDNAAGTIVDNVAFNPGVTTSTNVATIVFRAKADGQAQLAVAADSKLLDAVNADKNTGSSISASYTVSTPSPTTTPTPTVTTAPATTPPAVAQTTPTDGGRSSLSTAQSEEGATTTATTTDEGATSTPEFDAQLAAAAGADTGEGSGLPWYYILAGIALILILAAAWRKWGRKI